MDDTPTPIAEIDHGPSKLDVFLEENQKLLITAAVAIFLGVLGYVGYTGYSDMLDAQAGEALTLADDETQLQAIVLNHGTTASAAAAALLLADIKGTESAEDAINALRKFTSAYPNHAAIPTATTSLGLRLLNEGKLPEAEAQLSAVVDMENAEYIKPAAQIALGDIAQKNGDDERAREFYTAVTDLISDDSSSSIIAKFAPYKSMANNRLRFINASAPTEVEKKIAPVTPTATETTPAIPAAATAPEGTISEVPTEETSATGENNETNPQLPE